MKQCKNGEYGCGDYYDCGKCKRERMAAAYRNLTPEQKAYDRMADPAGAYHIEFPQGCSCHICAPCSFCTESTEEEMEQYLSSLTASKP